MPIRWSLFLLSLCLLLVCCGTPERAASLQSATAEPYPVPLASAYLAPTTLPSYPAPTPAQALAEPVPIDEPAPHLGIVFDTTLRIITIESNSPAAQAMLQVGDTIVQVNDQVVTTPKAFQDTIRPLLSEITITMSVERGGSVLRRTIDLRWRASNTPSEPSTATPVPSNLYYQ